VGIDDRAGSGRPRHFGHIDGRSLGGYCGGRGGGASSRLGAPSLRKMCKWSLAVLTLITSAAAISRFV
jgi:hypothetical protein